MVMQWQCLAVSGAWRQYSEGAGLLAGVQCSIHPCAVAMVACALALSRALSIGITRVFISLDTIA